MTKHTLNETFVVRAGVVVVRATVSRVSSGDRPMGCGIVVSQGYYDYFDKFDPSICGEVSGYATLQ